MFNEYAFDQVRISDAVLQDIIDFAKANHPKEFVAFLSGKIIKKTLEVQGLVYQPYVSDENEAVLWTQLPLLSGSVGSVHSHPGNNNRPSNADLKIFSKGLINISICKPYNRESIAVYDGAGRKLPYGIAQA